MNGIFTNNIFSNPKGWAEKAIGSHLRSRLMQAKCVTMAGCLSYVLFLFWRETRFPLVVYFGVLVFLAHGVVETFCDLRALRSFVVEAQLTRGTSLAAAMTPLFRAEAHSRGASERHR